MYANIFFRIIYYSCTMQNFFFFRFRKMTFCAVENPGKGYWKKVKAWSCREDFPSNLLINRL